MSKDDVNITEPANTLAKGVVDGAGAFLGRICLPAAEEFGLLLRDKVKNWRNNNFIKIAKQAEELISKKANSGKANLHPRILHAIYEEGSWSEENNIQKMWSGLMASSCFDDGTDKSIIYVDILSKMSKSEASLFDYVCKSSEWRISWSENLVEALPIFTESRVLKANTGLDSFEDVDESISHLQILGLIKNDTDMSNERMDYYDSTETNACDAFQSGTDGQWYNSIELTLTNLGIRFFLKVQGIEKRPSEYFIDIVPQTNDHDDFYYDDWH